MSLNFGLAQVFNLAVAWVRTGINKTIHRGWLLKPSGSELGLNLKVELDPFDCNLTRKSICNLIRLIQ